MLRVKSNRKAETPYVYKFTLECLGKSIECGVSYTEVSSLKERGQQFVAGTKKYFASMGNIIRGNREPREIPKKEYSTTGAAKKVTTRASSEKEANAI